MITMRDNAFIEKARQAEHERAEACYERVMSAEAHEAVSLPYHYEAITFDAPAPVDKAEQERVSLARKKANGDRFLAICAGLGIETVQGDE
jgi:hypothetical protein